MSKEISYAAALANKIENDEKLKFAYTSLDKELFDRIYKSYNKAKWSQLALPIAFVILVILELIFIPTDPSSNLKLQICYSHRKSDNLNRDFNYEFSQIHLVKHIHNDCGSLQYCRMFQYIQTLAVLLVEYHQSRSGLATLFL